MLSVPGSCLRSMMLQSSGDWARMPHECIVFCCPAWGKWITGDDKGNFFCKLHMLWEETNGGRKKDFEITWVVTIWKGGKMMLVNSSLVGFCCYGDNCKTFVLTEWCFCSSTSSLVCWVAGLTAQLLERWEPSWLYSEKHANAIWVCNSPRHRLCSVEILQHLEIVMIIFSYHDLGGKNDVL